MIKNVLTEIGGVGMYGVISICLFFAVFTGSLILAFLHRKPFLQSMSVLPLEDDASAAPVKGEVRHE